MYTNPFDTRQPLAKPAPNPIKIPPINALNKVFPSLPCNLNSPFPNEQTKDPNTIPTVKYIPQEIDIPFEVKKVSHEERGPVIEKPP